MTTTPFRGPLFLASNLVRSGASNRCARRVPVIMGMAILAAFLFGCGCASIKEGNEPFVVQSERALTIAKASIEAFVTVEHQNRAWVKANMPRIHESAEAIRRHAPRALTEAGKALRKYKAGRTTENRAAVHAGMAEVEAISAEASRNLSDLKTSKP